MERSFSFDTPENPFAISPAKSFCEIFQAYHIAYAQYCKYGLMQPKSNQLRYFLRELLPTANTFVARRNNAVVGTITGLLRGEAGLPSDKTFTEIYKEWGLDKRLVAEATKLACLPIVKDAERGVAGRSSVTSDLLRWTFWWYEHSGVDDWIAAIHPSHSKLWQDSLGFEFMTEITNYGYVKDNPCRLLRLDMKALREGKKAPSPDVEEFFLNHPIEMNELEERQHLHEREVMIFLLENQELLETCDPMELKALRKHFPLGVNSAERLIELEEKIQEQKILFSIIDQFQDVLQTDGIRKEINTGSSNYFNLHQVLSVVNEVLEVSATLDRKRFSTDIADSVPKELYGNPDMLSNLITESAQSLLQNSEPGERISMSVSCKAMRKFVALLQVTFEAPLLSLGFQANKKLPRKVAKRCELVNKGDKNLLSFSIMYGQGTPKSLRRIRYRPQRQQHANFDNSSVERQAS